MKLSARNVLAGKVIYVKRGATTSHVRIQIHGGAGYMKEYGIEPLNPLPPRSDS